MSLIWCNHRFMLEIGDHWNENTPSFDFLTNTQKCAAFSVIDFEWLKTLSHFFNLIFHLINIHLCPFQLHIIIKSVLTFFNVLPQFFHPSNFNINGINDLCTTCCLAFSEFEHFFIVTEFIKSRTKFFVILLCCLNVFKACLNSCFIEVERFSF